LYSWPGRGAVQARSPASGIVGAACGVLTNEDRRTTGRRVRFGRKSAFTDPIEEEEAMGRRNMFLPGAAVASLVAAVLPSALSAQPAPDLDGLTAAQAAADICAGKITSTALTTAAIARAKANTKFNAFITLDEAGAMKAAAAFDAGRKKGACKP